MIAEHATHSTSSGLRARHLNTTHRHAHMLGLHDHCNTLRLQLVLKEVCNFICQVLLNPKPLGKILNCTPELTQPCNLLIGNVGNVSFAKKGNNMVIAHCVERNVRNSHHLVDHVRVIEYSERERLCFSIAHVTKHLGEPLRCLHAMFAINIQPCGSLKEKGREMCIGTNCAYLVG